MAQLLSKGRYDAEIVSFADPKMMKSRALFHTQIKLRINGEIYFSYAVGTLETINLLYSAKEFYEDRRVRVDVRIVEHPDDENAHLNSLTIIKVLP